MRSYPALISAALPEARYRPNVTSLHRQIPLCLRVGTADQIPILVALANEHRIPLYPISTGRNWGLGSKLPVVDGCVVVDLSQLNQIIEVNESERYALIEPGVTQGQLAEYLSTHHPRLTFNVTGSFSETSIVGNVLDRGDGAYARIDDLLGVKGVLGSGEPFAVGGVWAQEGSGGGSHVSRYVAGPDLAG
ncbi:MAG TPA: FAD-dependent oxidoreductase, partial [Tepidisphaeraceae bacterium]|nr:FAD-dependent oxidoreductase [Tepidisphaeraceae bacterium]